MYRALLGVLLAASAVAALVNWRTSPTAPLPTPVLRSWYVNPVLAADFPDPEIVRHGDRYVVFATNSEHVPGHGIRRATSADLAHWRAYADAFAELPRWVDAARPRIWAPAVAQEPDESFVLLFAANDRNSGLQCLGIARAATPLDTFVSDPTPFLCPRDQGGALDPSVYEHSDGTRHLLWKNDGNCCGLPVHIWSQRINGRCCDSLGDPRPLIGPSQAWESGPEPHQRVVESPEMVEIGEELYLLYSANGWATSGYATGYATCDGASGPCEKPRPSPILSTSGDAVGPGGASVFEDAGGHLWVAYHAWHSANVGYDDGGSRSLRIDNLRRLGDRLLIDGPSTSRLPGPEMRTRRPEDDP